MSFSSPCAAPERRRLLATTAALAAWPVTWAQQVATPPEVVRELPGARLQGQGRLRYFGLHVYDVLLWTRERLAADDTAVVPLALELQYARRLRGPLIAQRSLEEMRRQAEIGEARARRWLDAMTRLFPDVDEGDRITGVQRPGEAARFHVNGRFAGELRDAEFARLFFGIWLSPQTSEPQLRMALLGGAR
jgi:hypothetical protein